MSLGSLTIADLTTDCDVCKGTGKDPDRDRPPANNSPFGQRTVYLGPGRCSNPRGSGGRMPSEAGWSVIEFMKVYGHLIRNSFRRAGA